LIFISKWRIVIYVKDTILYKVWYPKFLLFIKPGWIVSGESTGGFEIWLKLAKIAAVR
jgi:hypothetical protein